MQFLCFPILPGSAEAKVIWGGIVQYPLIAYFIRNISAKKYQNPFTYVKVIASQRWDVFETWCMVSLQISNLNHADNVHGLYYDFVIYLALDIHVLLLAKRNIMNAQWSLSRWHKFRDSCQTLLVTFRSNGSKQTTHDHTKTMNAAFCSTNPLFTVWKRK